MNSNSLINISAFFYFHLIYNLDSLKFFLLLDSGSWLKYSSIKLIASIWKIRTQRYLLIKY